MLKHYKDLSPYLRKCKSLQLSPDFLMPQDMGDDDTANETTTRSTIVDYDEPMSSCCSGSSSSSFSGSENISNMANCSYEIVKKKRSGWKNVFAYNRVSVSDEDMATSNSNSISGRRKKGIPHRSPLC